MALTSLLTLMERLPLTFVGIVVTILVLAISAAVVLKALPPVLHELPPILRARRDIRSDKDDENVPQRRQDDRS